MLKQSRYIIIITMLQFMALNAYVLDGLAKTTFKPAKHHVAEEEDRAEPLLVQCYINGFLIPAVIDTGAQISIMSEACLKRCHLHKDIDTRYKGRAIGVGHSEILGRVPSLPIRLGPVSFKSMISVLKDSRVDFIIGMDLLNKFESEINIKNRWIKLRANNKNYNYKNTGY